MCLPNKSLTMLLNYMLCTYTCALCGSLWIQKLVMCENSWTLSGTSGVCTSDHATCDLLVISFFTIITYIQGTASFSQFLLNSTDLASFGWPPSPLLVGTRERGHVISCCHQKGAKKLDIYCFFKQNKVCKLLWLARCKETSLLPCCCSRCCFVFQFESELAPKLWQTRQRYLRNFVGKAVFMVLLSLTPGHTTKNCANSSATVFFFTSSWVDTEIENPCQNHLIISTPEGQSTVF